MKTSLEIAQEAKKLPIKKISNSIGLNEEDIDLYGKYMAKINLSKEKKDQILNKPVGKYILVTGTNPTPAGEGKTTTSIGLTQGLSLLGHKTIVTLRQPSLGPIFGTKGGAAGALYSQVLPMEDINLGLTGDFGKIESAHNLLSAMLDNHIFRGNKLDLDLSSIQWPRVMDMNDRALREIVVALGDQTKNGTARVSGFDITAASEIMSLIGLSNDLPDLKKRLGQIIVGRNRQGKLVTAADVKATGSMATLLRNVLLPNLVQTTEGQACIMHTGPFGNIAHGCSSIIGDELALHLADYVVTEAGFGSDLGAEKFFNIKCRQSGMYPNAVVLVTTIKALKMHGGLPYDKNKVQEENFEALIAGLSNLKKHMSNLIGFGSPVVVALNYFPTDTEKEIDIVKTASLESGAYGFALNKGAVDGGKGAIDLANMVLKAVETNPNPKRSFTYKLTDSIEEKIVKIAKTIYGAKEVKISPKAQQKIDSFKKDGYNDLPICMAKTHLSLSSDPKLLGAPSDFTVDIDDIRLNAGSGFIYPLVGSILTMPGLGAIPSAEGISIDDEGVVSGLF